MIVGKPGITIFACFSPICARTMIFPQPSKPVLLLRLVPHPGNNFRLIGRKTLDNLNELLNADPLFQSYAPIIECLAMQIIMWFPSPRLG